MSFDDGRAWGERHRAWLATIDLGQPAAQATLADACGAVDALCHRRDQLERQIVALLGDSPWQVQVGRLRCLRGVDTLTAAGLCAEIGDFERFARDRLERPAAPAPHLASASAPPAGATRPNSGSSANTQREKCARITGASPAKAAASHAPCPSAHPPLAIGRCPGSQPGPRSPRRSPQ